MKNKLRRILFWPVIALVWIIFILAFIAIGSIIISGAIVIGLIIIGVLFLAWITSLLFRLLWKLS